jgi:hypothetical protein
MEAPMPSDFNSRLDKLVARKAAMDETGRQEKEARAHQEADLDKRREQAGNRWRQRELPTLKMVVLKINDRLKASGMALAFEDEEMPDKDPIGHTMVKLTMSGRWKRSRLHFNMTALGKIQIIHSSPHKPPKETSFDTLEEGPLGALLTDFAEEAFDSEG